MKRHIKGTGILFPILMRQHRLRLLLWLAGLVLVTCSVAYAYPGMYPDQASREAYSITMENPAMIAMLGIGYEHYQEIGSLFALEMLLFSAIAVAIMNILLMSRLTRDDEENGILELVQSKSVGRLSYLTASFMVMLSANILLIILLVTAMTAMRIDGFGFSGIVLYSSLLGSFGLLFGTLTAFFAHLATSSRGTSIFSFGALFFFYLLRAIGDVEVTFLSWISPLGWLSRAYVFVGNNSLPVVLLLVSSIGIGMIAFILQAKRDIGDGLLPERAGAMRASAFLKTKIGLGIRLQRTMILMWMIGILLLNIVFALILGDLEAFFLENEAMQAFLTGDGNVMEQFIVLLMAIMALFITAPVIISFLRLRGEEKANRTELLFSRAVSRMQLLRAYLVSAIMIAVVLPTLQAITLWSVGFIISEEMMSFADVLGASVVYIPALLLVLGIAVLLIGWLPKATSLVWVFLVYGFIVIYLGDILELPDWVRNLSVYEYIPAYPNEELSYPVLLILSGISILMMVIGALGYKRRDMEG
ncbi:ABC transporter permease [Oceanobacillus sp. CFH 90083]|uniref:ABC transporter permease n=1 Tax=Oceanobacillus sp. CFH 90083 TaxID=2592336 RepID=UPI00128E86FA|nr:ABC transporter permease [Oceanobacillus sp. CFH 90083]